MPDLSAIAADFDRIVIATGAKYRLGLGRIIVAALRNGWGKSGWMRALFESPRVKHWFYYRARMSARPRLGKLKPDNVVVIGDAASPGKTRDAIESAFRAALTP